MKATDIEKFVRSLGQSYASLNLCGLLDGQPLDAIFPEDDRRYVYVEHGVELDFDADSLVAEKLLFTVFDVVGPQPLYQGDVWPGLHSNMNQTEIRALLGPPISTGPPGEYRFGEHGGWDEFRVVPEIENVVLSLNYLPSTQARAFAFVLNLL